MNLAEKLKQFNEQHEDITATHRDEKVLIIDGLNGFIRCFSATPTMNDNGEHVGGITGFLRSIGVAIRQFRPSRCVVIFDGKGGSQRRREIFKDYKDNRRMMDRLNRTYDFQTKEEESQSQRLQLRKLVELMQYLPITIMAPDNVEADDVIAYLAKLAVERGGKSIIMSTDKDFLQLVCDDITVYNPIKKKLYTPELVLEEYGIHPINFIIYRTIEGDTSDNIPGVKGVGAATLKKNFPELAKPEHIPWEHIFAAAEGMESKASQLILSNKQIIERNTTLMRLDEQQMSGNTKMKVLEQFDSEIPKLNKLSLTQAFMHDRLLGAFANLDEWVLSTFVPLSKFSEK